MATVYKIHPAIGIARVGDHPSAFFIGPEAPDIPGAEIGSSGNETPVARYKEGGRIKRQAARFRLFRFHQDETGRLELVGEVTADDAEIEWRVDLCNRKGALDHSPSSGHPADARNVDVADRNNLIIKNAQPLTISGRNQPSKEFNGQFLGKPVYLGELRTDGKGRLLVLGGRGKSESVPPGEPLNSFANNDKWHDDVSDGPVTAVVTLPGQEPVVAHHSSWAVVAPPDFAPGIGAIVTLYDVAFQAAIEKGVLSPDVKPSFRRHIKPLVERAGSLRLVNDFNKWTPLAIADMNALADTGTANAPLRQQIARRLKSPGLDRFNMPTFMQKYLDQWAVGDFISDLNGTDAPTAIPDQLDRAALEACVGNNFYPGIEASINLKDKDIYARPFRLDHTNLAKAFPGCITEIMAVPWQADFIECDDGVWWPSQRPDIAMIDGNDIPGSEAGWADPLLVVDHQGMIEHALQLGFVVATTNNAGQSVFVEQDRDPQFPRDQPSTTSCLSTSSSRGTCWPRHSAHRLSL
ncbi:LodA/GoxA family CTQ-dependent oxidase [Mesorhizobium sp. M0012]|uniref:LodA/GoxA family CTQ-dependent oxidase n=1 Tax=Mesorhizobium sp. M0012 TaxID=2956840 RepID=UPI003339E824